jgi:hypothetical protein
MDGRSADQGDARPDCARHAAHHLFPAAPGQVTLGRADGEAKLTATGDSVAPARCRQRGLKVRLAAARSARDCSKRSVNLPNIVVTKMFGDKQVKTIAAADLVASNGVFDARPLSSTPTSP